MNQTHQMATRGQRGVTTKKTPKQLEREKEKLHKAYKAAKEPKGSKKRSSMDFPPYFVPWMRAMEEGVPGAADTLRKLVTEFNKFRAQKVPLNKMVCTKPLLQYHYYISFLKLFNYLILSLSIFHTLQLPMPLY